MSPSLVSQYSLGCLRQSAVADGKRSATFLSRTSPIQSCRRCLYLRVWLAHYWSCPLFEFCLVNRFALPVFFLLLVACPALLAASPPLSHDPAPSSRGNAPAPSTATASTSIRSTSRHNTVQFFTSIPSTSVAITNSQLNRRSCPRPLHFCASKSPLAGRTLSRLPATSTSHTRVQRGRGNRPLEQKLQRKLHLARRLRFKDVVECR